MRHLESFLEGMAKVILNPSLRGFKFSDIISIARFEKMDNIDKFLESVPSMNSELFTYENYAMNNGIQIDSYHIFNTHTLSLDPDFEFVGKTDGSKLRICSKKDTIALMITHKRDGFDCWFHFYISDYYDWKQNQLSNKLTNIIDLGDDT